MASPGAPTATRATASSFARVPRWQREWLAASLGCTVADTIFNPLEVLKVRRQIAVASTTAASAAPSSSASSSTLGLARSAIAERGLLRGLWLPGLEATCYRAFSYTGFRIGMYPSVRDAVARTMGGGDERASSDASASGASASSLPSRLAAGALTGAIGSAVFNPIDVVRVRQQGATPYPSTLGAFVEVARSEGVVSGLYRGLGACVLRAAMLSGSQLATYDTAKRWLRGDEGSPWAARGSPWAIPEGPALHFAASFLSGVVAQTATQPADTLKTLAMAETGNGDGAGTIAVARKVWRAGGVRAFYRGFWPAAARQGPVMVIQMPIVEQFRNALGLEYF